MRKLVFSLVMLFFLFFNIKFAISVDEKTAKQIFESKCSSCHSLEWPLERRKTKDGWKETVKRMRKKTAGNVITDEDEKIIVDYLYKIRGK